MYLVILITFQKSNNCNMHTLPSLWLDAKVITLNCSYKQFENSEIKDDAFSNGINLQVLNLNNNKLTLLIINWFEKLTNLQELYLQHNAFITVPAKVFHYNVKLKMINLNNNEIEYFLFTLSTLEKLVKLGIKNNKLKTLEKEYFSIESKKRTHKLIIKASQNMLTCDCKHAWIRTAVNSSTTFEFIEDACQKEPFKDVTMRCLFSNTRCSKLNRNITIWYDNCLIG